MNTSNSSLQAPPQHLPNLTWSPWPARPYLIELYPRYGAYDLIINSAVEFRGSRPVSVPGLLDFVQEFRDNLEREFPIPGNIPRLAMQNNFDIQSYTEWVIEIDEGIFGNRLPTEVASLALEQIEGELESHGIASLFFSIKEDFRLHSYGFLGIEEFGGDALNRSLAKERRSFQTS